MVERLRIRKQRQLDKYRRTKKFFFHLNNLSNSSNEQQQSPIRSLSKSQKRNRLKQLFFPTRSRVKLHQSQLSTTQQLTPPLNQHMAKLNQRAVDVQNGIENSLSSLHTQRLQYLTSLNEKTRDLEKAAAAFEHSSSKHLQQELSKTKTLAYLFKICITICLTLFSLMIIYMIIQLIRDKDRA